jgi:hypothetical protein
MLFVNRLFQRMMGHAFNRRARRRREFSPFGIQAAQVESLENRRLLSALTVTTAADSGAGSLRAEIAAANNGDTINFASSLKRQTIALTSGELLVNKGLTIQGPGAAQLTISGGNHSRVFDVASSQPVVLTGLTISNGVSGLSNLGGDIYDASGSNLTVSACTISNGHAGRGKGGGIDNLGNLTLNQCTISGGYAFLGGGIFNQGTLTATNCTLSGDVAQSGGGIYNSGTLTVCGSSLTADKAGNYGGGIDNLGTLNASGCTLSGDSTSQEGGGIYVGAGQATLTNCTIAGNFAYAGSSFDNATSGMGGGVYVGGGNAVLTNCTVSLNWAGWGGGIDVVLYGANLDLFNTIVAGNKDYSPAVFGFSELSNGPDIYGPVATADHNLIGRGMGAMGSALSASGNIVGIGVINAMLGPLQNNGGPTMTMALLAGSPAIGTADNSAALATDQRGVARADLAGELTDIGAYEV